MAKMKPCPFCGNEEPRFINDDGAMGESPVWWYCSNCRAIGPDGKTKSAATRLWNKRSKEG